jgi:hypothetical protein
MENNMAKHQKQKPRKWDVAAFPQQVVFNPVIEGIVRTIMLHFTAHGDSNKPFADARMHTTKPFAAVAPHTEITVGFYHNGFEEIIINPSLASKLAMQGFRLQFVYDLLSSVHSREGVPAMWLEGTKQELTVPIRTTLAALEYAVMMAYKDQCIADYEAAAIAQEQRQLTKDSHNA